MKYDNKPPNLLEGEPWFLIRGRDIFAFDAITAYADLAAKASSQTDNREQSTALMQHALQCLKIAERFLDWKFENPDKMRNPKPEARRVASETKEKA